MDRVVLERCARRIVHAVAVGLTAGLAGMASCAPDQTRDEPGNTARVNASPPASSYESSPVRFELISDVDRVQPGVAFRLGVLVTLEPGWFVHWRYAGVSGQATTVDLTMPYDFEAGPVAWPTPSRFERSDGTTRYGYAERVLLTSVIQASNVGDDVYWPFEADVGLVACATECVSARATLGLALHHSVSGTRLEHFVNRRLFDEWALRVPTPSDAPERPFTARFTNQTGGAAPVLLLRWNDPAASVDWFPLAETDAAFPASIADTEDGLTRITLRHDTAAPHAETVGGVVAYVDRGGERRGVELSLPVDGASLWTP